MYGQVRITRPFIKTSDDYDYRFQVGNVNYTYNNGAGHDISIWHADGRGFDPRVRQHSFVEIGYEIISSAILSLPLIQVGQLSVTGERMCT